MQLPEYITDYTLLFSKPEWMLRTIVIRHLHPWGKIKFAGAPRSILA
jgi:hypothetical protein